MADTVAMVCEVAPWSRVMDAVLDAITGVSLEPVMLTVMLLDVPSAACTVKVSLTTAPYTIESYADAAVYVQAPLVPMTRLP